VGDCDGRASFCGLFERVLDEDFGLRVDCRRGFVENEDGGVSDERSSYGEALPLAFAQLVPAASYDGVESVAVISVSGQVSPWLFEREYVRQRRDEVVYVGLFACLFYGGVGYIFFIMSSQQVHPYRSTKHSRLLIHQPDAAAVLCNINRGDGIPVKEDGSAVRVIEPLKQRHDRALAAASVTDKGNARTGRDGK